MRKLIAFLFFASILVHCTTKVEPKKTHKTLYSLSHFQVPVAELNDDQQSAFDALNELQVSTDEKNKLYSTFANIEHPCYPPDSSFEISQSDLQIVMEQFIDTYCKKIEPAKQNELARSSVLAQDHYTVFYCKEIIAMEKKDDKFPLRGKWIFPSVLGRRDIILNW